MAGNTNYRRSAGLLVALGVVAVAACEAPAPLLAPDQALLSQGRSSDTPASVNQQVAALRAHTAPFHNFDKAVEAGYGARVTDCYELPGVGGMGFHFANFDFFDGDTNLLEPQVLVYEPMKNGRLRLVAIEYIVPFDFAPADGPAPVLMGQPYNPIPGVGWALHVWVWKHNPLGMFADWNPTVSCQFEDAYLATE
jgi:hypothetical protein